MRKQVLVFVTLLMCGLITGQSLAQVSMQLAESNYGSGVTITTQRVECLSDMSALQLSMEELSLLSNVNLITGLDDFDGGGTGLSDGNSSRFCLLHAFLDPCGSCTLDWGAEGQRYWTEFWCVGVKIFTSSVQCLWCP